MKLLNIFNLVQSLVESFTFYGGAPSSGGGAMGGGRPSNPMQRMNPRFGGNPNMPQGQPGMPSMPQGMPQNPMFRGMGLPPAQSQGMPPMPQVSPPQGGFPQQAQGMPMQPSFGQLTPDMLNNMKMKLQGMGLPANQGQAQAPTPYSRTANYEGTGGLLKTIRGY